MDIKSEAKQFFTKVQAYSLWIVLCVAFGFWIGLQYGRSQANDRFNDATRLGGMIYNEKVYDVRERELQPRQ